MTFLQSTLTVMRVRPLPSAVVGTAVLAPYHR
jgi:hypothetical protein